MIVGEQNLHRFLSIEPPISNPIPRFRSIRRRLAHGAHRPDDSQIRSESIVSMPEKTVGTTASMLR
ncbi:hypothetical protein J3S89_11865 [Pinisolibacter sp. B13]|uniref:hypothetical protein n=1 Tax=Pinisolibacter aquiterrae TaxID=2815579 RepID=UPI001C3CAE70|nr:hypothetical protein [Pinisolibacter aquiterrae]MBV5264740.1 hypothetical protein [Pinisolibacter aquiterrae]MCC8237089.1 hypothetical protein [Pinisolibacter aquiterrae]